MNARELLLVIEEAIKQALNARNVSNVVGIVDNTVQVAAKTHNGQHKFHSITIEEVGKSSEQD